MASERIKNLVKSIDIQPENLTPVPIQDATLNLDAPLYPTDDTLCRLADLAYEAEHKKIEQTLIQNEWKDWTLVAMGQSKQYFDYYFGAAFWHQKYHQLVISHKGTKNILRDGKADVQGVIKNEYTSQLHMACTFAFVVLKSLGTDKCSISITGHSLGGWLAQVTAFAIEHLLMEEQHFREQEKKEDRKYHPHTVVFDSPGCYEMLFKLSNDYFLVSNPYRYTSDDLISVLDITNYVIAPNLISCKNQHVGKLLSFHFEIEKKDFTYDSAFKNLAPRTGNYHELKQFLCCFQNVQVEIHNVLNWPKNFKQYKKYVDYVAPNKENKKKKYSDLKETNCGIKFEIEPYNEAVLGTQIFREEEFIFLLNWKTLKEDGMNPLKNVDGDPFKNDQPPDFDKFLPDFEITEKGIKCSESADSKKVVNRIKRLAMAFPKVLQEVKQEMSNIPKIFQAIYKALFKSYVETLPKYEIDFEDTIELTQFLNTVNGNITVLITKNTKDDAFRIYNIVKRSKIYHDDHYTFLSVKDIEYLQNCVDVPFIFGSSHMIDNLLVIDFENENDFSLIKDLHDKILNGCKKKIICIAQKVIPEVNIIQREIPEPGLTDLSEHSQESLLQQRIISLNGTEFNLNDFLKTNKLAELSSFLPFDVLKENFLTKAKKTECNLNNKIFENIHLNLSTAKVLKEVQLDSLKNILDNYESKLKPAIRTDIQNVLFLISGVDENPFLQDLARKYDKQIILHPSTDQDESSEHFQKLCLQNPRKTIFRLHMTEPENNILTWIDIFDPELYINRKFSIYGNAQVNEQELIVEKDKIVLISNEPGMGKSTTLSNLARNISESWILWVSLLEAHKYVSKSTGPKPVDLNDVTEFLSKLNDISSTLAKNLLKFSLTRNDSVPVYLFFDAFDEIQDSKNKKEDTIRNQVLDIITYLRKETSAKIFISTRTYHCEAIKRALDTFSIGLKEISDEEQIEFCTKFWMDTLSLVQGDPVEIRKNTSLYAKNLLKNFKDTIVQNQISFLGIPLQLRMIVEIFRPHETVNFNQMNMDFNLYNLYSKFIDQKYEIYFKEKTCFPTPDFHRESLLPPYQEQHRNLGMTHLFPAFGPKINYTNIIIRNLKRIGLVQVEGETITFVHRTFAECFAAELFVQRMDDTPEQNVQKFLVENLFSEYRYSTIQRFISDILATCKKNKKVVEFYPEIWGKITDNATLDLQWKNYFFALIKSNSAKLMELILENFKYRPSFKNDFINSRDSRAKLGINTYDTIVREAIRKGDPDMAVIILEYGANVDHITSRNYKIKRQVNENVQNIFNGGYEYKEGVKSFLHLTSKKNKLNPVSLKLLKKKVDYKIKNINGEDPWDVAARSENWDLFLDGFEFFENDRPLLHKWGIKIFQHALQKGNLDVQMRLFDKGITESIFDVYDWWNLIMMLVDLKESSHPEDYDKVSFAWICIRTPNSTIWDYILQLEDINITNRKRSTFLHFAIAQNSMDVANELVQRRASVTAIDDYENTPLYLAAKNNHWGFVIESINEVGLSKEPKKWDILRLAYQQNQSSGTVKLIAEKIKESWNSESDYRKSLLRVVAEEDKPEFMLEFMGQEADSDDLNFLLRVACEQNKKNIALYLVQEKKRDISITDENGNTPILLAAKNGHWDLVTALIQKSNIHENKWEKLIKPNNFHETLLRFACKDNKSELALYFIKKGADLKFSDQNLDTAELVAAKEGHWNLVHKLIGSDRTDIDLHRINTLARLACESNQFDLAVEFKKKVADVSDLFHDRNNPFILAAEKGHWISLRKLIDDFDSKTMLTETRNHLLSLACENNQVDLVLKLVNKDNINAPIDIDGNNTPALMAARKGHWELVKKLRKIDGFDGNQSNRNRESILHFACRSNEIELISDLIKKGADITFSEICLAAEKAHWNLVQKLMESEPYKKLKVSIKEKEQLFKLACDQNKLDFALKLIINADFTDSREFMVGLCSYLFDAVQQGAKPNPNNTDDNTSLLTAARCGHADLAITLIKKLKQSNEFDPNVANKYGKTLLHFATQHNKIDLVETLLEEKADIDLADNDENTAILIAAGNGHWELVETLKKRGASTASINIYNETLLHLACRDNKKELAMGLIASGMNINFPNGFGRTPLFFAAEFGNWQFVSELIELGADPNVRDKDKTTILHFACRDDEREIVEMLVTEKKLNPKSADVHGISPLFLAIKYGHDDLVEKILSLE